MTAVYASSSVLVRPASAVVILSPPGAFSELLSTVRSLDVTRVLNGNVVGGVLSRIRRVAAAGVRSFGSFNMLGAVLSGPMISQLIDSGLIQSVWEDLEVSISQYPVAPPSATWQLKVPLSGSLTFTDSRTVRSLVGADVANAAGYTGAGVRSTIVDTGVALANPQLHRVRPHSAVRGDYTDLVGHGSMTASTLGGAPAKAYTLSRLVHGDVECQGMAPGTSLSMVKALDFPGTAPTSQLLAGLDLAYRIGTDVLSLSWGSLATATDPTADVYYVPVQTFLASGAIVVGAIGNSGLSGQGVDSPGCLPGVIGVGSYNPVTNLGWNGMFGDAGTPSGFSSRGPTPWGSPGPSTVAPGGPFVSGVSGAYLNEMSVSYTNYPSDFQALAGTSFAAPVVAGLLACMRQAHAKVVGRTLSNPEVLAMLSAQANGAQDPVVGYGPLSWSTYQAWVLQRYGITI